jgi:hypothetical protein
MGCMKLVGEAFKDSLEENAQRTVILGIANWHSIRGKESLITKNVFIHSFSRNDSN